MSMKKAALLPSLITAALWTAAAVPVLAQQSTTGRPKIRADVRMLMQEKTAAAAAVPLLAQQSTPGRPKIRADVLTRMQEKGIAKVGVKLTGQWRLEPDLSPSARNTQRHDIAAAQQRLLAELHGTIHRVIGVPKTVSYLSLEVGPDALNVLKQSALVKEVFLQEAFLAPSLSESVG